MSLLFVEVIAKPFAEINGRCRQSDKLAIITTALFDIKIFQFYWININSPLTPQ